MLVPEELARFIINNQEDLKILSEKIAINFGASLLPQILPVLEQTNLKELKAHPYFQRFFSNFYVIPTTDCNMACIYCNAQSCSKRYMRPKDLKKILKIIENFRENESKIIIYGGEPLLNGSIIKKMITNLREIEGDFPINIITNGTLIKDHYAQFFKKNDVSISISLDGLQPENDMARVFLDKSGSYDQIIRGINLLRKSSLPFSISCTIGRHNYHCLPKIAEYFANVLEPKSVAFNLLRGNSPLVISFENSTDMLLKAGEILRSKGIYEDRVFRKLICLVEEKFHFADCTGCGHQLTFHPDGSIGICHIDTIRGNFITHIDEEEIGRKIKNSKELLSWRSRIPLLMDLCKDCDYIGVCGGGCPLEVRDRTGSMFSLDEPFCKHTEMVFNYAMKRLIDSLEL